VPDQVKQETLARIARRPWNILSDFESSEVREKLAAAYGLAAENVLVGNGSNELLAAAGGNVRRAGTRVVVRVRASRSTRSS